MIIGIPKEIINNEKRVAIVPETAKRLKHSGIDVLVESNAGAAAYFTNEEYERAGAKICQDYKEVYEKSDIIIKVRPLDFNNSAEKHESDLIRSGAVLISFLQPFNYLELIMKLKDRKITAFAMELIPRITRAQPMDALTSQSTVAGYKAIIFAANRLPKFLPLMMTAAMTVRPAKVLVIGAGVAGLQAIATARRLGAVVKGIDTRPAVKEQVESLGASFVVLPVHDEAEDKGGYAKDLGEEFYRKEQNFILPHLVESDIVVTTAQIPGKRAPLLITEDMVNKMRPGSVIVDLAIETGGNCSLSRAGEIIEKNGVIVYGFSDAPSSMPYHASMMYSKNIEAFLNEITNNGKININTENEIVKSTLITKDGEIFNEDIMNLIKKRG